jgi:hypothetical protein
MNRVREELSPEKFDKVLVEYEMRWEKTRNPIYVWQAIAMCIRYGGRVNGEKEFKQRCAYPTWVLEYLFKCAGGISTESGNDVGRALPRIFGFSDGHARRGRGSAFSDAQAAHDDAVLALAFVDSIDKGHTPVQAREAAAELLARMWRIKDPRRETPDDKMVARRIKRYFEVGRAAPKSTAEWQELLDQFYIRAGNNRAAATLRAAARLKQNR